MRLNKADILSRAATKTKDIQVPEWAVGKEKPPTVSIKAWSIADRDMILNEMRERLSGVQVSTLAPQVVAVSLVDADGELMFGSEEGVKELCELAHEGLIRVMNAAYHFNGLGAFATDEEGEQLRAEAAAERAEGDTPEEEEDPKN